MLYEGQKVNVGLINPIISVVVDVHSVGEEERTYDTEIQYDSNQYVGYQEVIRNGENGYLSVSHTANDYYHTVKDAIANSKKVSSIAIKQEYQEHYSMVACAKKYFQLFGGIACRVNGLQGT